MAINISNIKISAASWTKNNAAYLSLTAYLYDAAGGKYDPKCVQSGKSGASNTDAYGTITSLDTNYNFHIHSDYGCWNNGTAWRLEYVLDPYTYGSTAGTWMPNTISNDLSKYVVSIDITPAIPLSGILLGSGDNRNTNDTGAWNISFNNGMITETMRYTNGSYNNLISGTPLILKGQTVVKRNEKYYCRLKAQTG